jgi:cyclophilin family peptidyl-prolyl cis-trans isomerase
VHHATILIFAALSFIPAFAQSVNKFNDPVIRRIHDLADRREAISLLPYLRDTNPNYRGEALFCFGSIQDPGLADSLFNTMQVEQPRVRMMGAWALGQIGKPEIVPLIRKGLEGEQDPLVRGMFHEALGKCGSEEDLNWLAAMDVPFQETEGQATGIFRFGLRSITSVAGNERMLKLFDTGTSQTGMVYAACFLGRYAGMDWLQANPDPIVQVFQKEKNEEVRSNLVKAVIRAKDEEAWPLAKAVLDSDQDYRTKVNILNSMTLMPWNKAMKTVYALAASPDPNLSLAAAEAVQKQAVYTDLQELLKSIDAAKNWRSRSLMLGKALELVAGKPSLVKKIEKMIFESATAADKPTVKAWYCKALATDPIQYTFLENLIKTTKDPVVYTSSLETLEAMRKSKNFDAAAKELAGLGIDLEKELQRIAKENPMPVDPAPGFTHSINWELVQRLAPKQKVAIMTTKGEFIVQLNVTWCPGTCAAFVELIESGFYKNLSIHRVVPNFVVQDGCSRGDGWGGPDFTIRSEFSPTPFREGTLGMASSGKDTEGSQWYVTHSPTPHLDGKYTNFGFVVSGMEVVHQLEVGDLIIDMELLAE